MMQLLLSYLIISREKHISMIEDHLESQQNAALLESSNSSVKASKVTSNDLPSSSSKKFELADPDPMVQEGSTLVDQVPEAVGSHKYNLESSTSSSVHVLSRHDLSYINCPQSGTGDNIKKSALDREKDFTELPLKQTYNPIGSSVTASHGWSNWKPFEKDLYRKGLEIFGRNRYVNLNFMIKIIFVVG